MLSSIGAALTPKADFSLGDIIDEVRTLRDENAALKAQLAVHSRAAITSEEVPPPPEEPPAPATPAAPVTPAAAAAPAPSTANAADTLFDRIMVMSGGEAVELEGEPVELAPRDDADVTARCLASELRTLEAVAETTRVQGHVEREELALRCEELGRALEQRVLQAERAQHEAVEDARRASRQQVEALEEQLAWLAEEQAQRDALDDGAYGEHAKLEAAEQRAAELRYRCDKYEAERGMLQRDLDAERAKHAEELRRAERTAAEHLAESESRLRQVQSAQTVRAQLEAQLVRLSEGFNKQVEEVLAVQRKLDQTKAQSVDKATARSWIVNLVEATQQGGRGAGHAAELLGLMSEWWAFTREDKQRVGLSDAPHPSVEAAQITPSERSLMDAFASFLDDESAEELGAQQQRQRGRPAQQQRGMVPERRAIAEPPPQPPGKAVLLRQPPAPAPTSPVRVTATPSLTSFSTPRSPGFTPAAGVAVPPAVDARSLSLLGAPTPATADARGRAPYT